MKAVPNGRRQSASQTQMNNKVIEGLYLLKKELKQQKSIGEQNLAVIFREKLATWNTEAMNLNAQIQLCKNEIAFL